MSEFNNAQLAVSAINNDTVKQIAQNILNNAISEDSPILAEQLSEILSKNASVQDITAIFNSGGNQNYKQATDCRNEGLNGNGYQISDTEAGKALDNILNGSLENLGYIPKGSGQNFVNLVSSMFADQATGDIIAFVSGSSIDSVWLNAELPALLSKGSGRVNGIELDNFNSIGMDNKQISDIIGAEQECFKPPTPPSTGGAPVTDNFTSPSPPTEDNSTIYAVAGILGAIGIGAGAVVLAPELAVAATIIGGIGVLLSSSEATASTNNTPNLVSNGNIKSNDSLIVGSQIAKDILNDEGSKSNINTSLYSITLEQIYPFSLDQKLLYISSSEEIARQYESEALDTVNKNIITDLYNNEQNLQFKNTSLSPLSLTVELNITSHSFLALDPLVLDLTGKGISLTSINRESPYVDYNNTGLAEKTSWIGAGAGILVNLNQDGKYLILGENSVNGGFASLASLDVNNDGVINSQDSAYTTLRVWTDDNHDGIMDANELHSLADLGIASINLTTTTSNTILEGNTITEIGSFILLDGTIRQIAEVNLQVGSTYTKTINPISISSTIQALPQLNQYGVVSDLHTAMMNDSYLTGLVNNLTSNITTMTIADIQLSTRDILYRWAGVDNVDPYSRGGVIDARRIEFLEKYLGQTFTFSGYYGQVGDPGTLPALITNQAWVNVEARTIARFLLQADTTISNEFNLDTTQDIISPNVNIPTSLNDLFSSIGTLNANSLDAWTKVAYVLGAIRQDYGIDEAGFGQDISFLVNDLDILQNAVTQGLAVNFASDGTLVVSNSPQDGIFYQGFGRESGLTFVYNAQDGKVEIQFSNPGWLAGWQGWTGNKLFVGFSSTEAVSTIDQYGNMVITDGITGDKLTIDGEGLSGNTQYGVQNIQFVDGTVWKQARITAIAGQTDLTSGFEHIDYDTKGLVSTIETTGDNNGIIYNLDYGAISATFSGVNNVIRFGANISASDITATLSGQNVILTDGATGDSLTLLNDFYTNYLGINSHVSAITFQDGTVEYLGQNAILPFTWLAEQGADNLVGSQYGMNKFILDNNSDTVTFGNNSLGSSGKNILNFSKGNGSVLVNTNGGTGEIDFGAGITADDILLQAGTNNTLVVALKDDPTDSITLQGDLYQIYNGIGSLVSILKFQAGSTMQIGPTLSLSWQASGGNTITGSGWGSNTYIIGAGGATINPGHGQFSGNYDNTYVYSKGDGVVNANVAGSWTYLKLSSDFTPDDVMLQSVGNTMVVAFKNSPDDKLIFANDLYPAYGNAGSSLRHITFSDGTNYDIGYTFYGQGAPIHFADMGTATHTTLVGSQYGDNLFILGAGGDTILPGTGQQGGSIENRYVFSRGIGHAVADTSGSWNNVFFGSGINQSDVVFQSVGNDLVVSLKGDEADSITFQHDFYQAYGSVMSAMKYVTFNDGSSYKVGYTDYGNGAPVHFTETETSTSNVLVGSGFGDNTFLLGPNSDIVTGGNGSLGGSNLNIYEDNGITGSAVINPNGGISQLVMTSLTETDVNITTNANQDLLASTSIVDSVAITAGLAGWNTTSLTFQDGSVWNKAQLTQVATGVTTCSTGDDVLVAQTSNQTLTGNGGNDQYVVGLNKSTTIVDNSSNLDTVQHGKLIVGLDESNIWLSQSGDDLLVQALNSADLVDIKNWFTGIGNQLASLQTHDGYKVSDISGLVSAMSAYSSANPSFSVGSTVMPNDTILQSALTNSWHK